jgi:DNA-binding response OmpR family regulator
MRAYNFQRIAVLVIDDNRNMANVIIHMLKAFGVGETSFARDGTEGLKLLDRKDYDLVIVDEHMSPMSGSEFVRHVRRGDAGPDPMVPIIMVTAHSNVQRVLAARDAGVNEILRKPLSTRMLFKRLTAVVDQQRAFVRTPAYVGPDRRRRQDPAYRGPDRRSTDGR